MAITIELPTDLEERLERSWAHLERHALEGFVVEAFRNHKIGSFEAGRILGMENRVEIIAFLCERGVYPGYDVEDYETDMESLEKLRNKRSA